jgi:hypothetical protein
MRLLADPSGFDRGGEHLKARISRQVRHIVFLLAGRPAFADEPDLVAWHALHSVIEHAVLMAIGNADAAGREETCQPTFSAASPADPSPFSSSHQRFNSDRLSIRNVIFAGPPGLRDGEDQSNVGGIDILASRQPYRPQQTALAQSLTERPAGAVPRIGKDTAETHARGDDAVDRSRSPASSEWSVYPPAHEPAPCDRDHLSSFRAGIAAGPPSPEPRATPTLARPATGSWRSSRATRHIAARRRPNARPFSAMPCRRRSAKRRRRQPSCRLQRAGPSQVARHPTRR